MHMSSYQGCYQSVAEVQNGKTHTRRVEVLCCQQILLMLSTCRLAYTWQHGYELTHAMRKLVNCQ